MHLSHAFSRSFFLSSWLSLSLFLTLACNEKWHFRIGNFIWSRFLFASGKQVNKLRPKVAAAAAFATATEAAAAAATASTVDIVLRTVNAPRRAPAAKERGLERGALLKSRCKYVHLTIKQKLQALEPICSTSLSLSLLHSLSHSIFCLFLSLVS